MGWGEVRDGGFKLGREFDLRKAVGCGWKETRTLLTPGTDWSQHRAGPNGPGPGLAHTRV